MNAKRQQNSLKKWMMSLSTMPSFFIQCLVLIFLSRNWTSLAFPSTNHRVQRRSQSMSRTSSLYSNQDPFTLLNPSYSNARGGKPIPRHVAFICDGNSRWAQDNNCSTSQGHSKGADRLVDLLEILQGDGIAYCTLFAFSTENWNRPTIEIQEIFRVMEETARRLLPRLLQDSHTIQLRILGDLQDQRIPFGLRKILQELQTMTRQSSSQKENSLTVCLAINYGGRQDILQATQQLAIEVAAGRLTPEAITQNLLASFLTTSGIPDPDLIIRTSGEHRLSNFLLWNVAYSELYITDVLWPDFDAACWQHALMWYQQRNRRFGSRCEARVANEKPSVPLQLNGNQQTSQ